MIFELPHVDLYEPGTAPPSEVGPKPVPEPEGVMTEQGDDFAVIIPDHYAGDRETELTETNATQPDRPATPSNLWWRVAHFFTKSLTGWRVSPQGKITLDLTKGNGPLYFQMMQDFCGERNMEAATTPGNGYFDTGNFMCSPSASDVVEIEDSILQNGTWYDVVKRMNISVAPVRTVDDGGKVHWFYGDDEVSYWKTPQYFNCRTNRRIIKDIDKKRWITRSREGEFGVNNVSSAQAGHEPLPLVADEVAVQPRSKLRRYPSTPRMVRIYAKSLIVDGELSDPGAYIDIVIDATKHTGSNVHVRKLGTDDWYLAEEMLVREIEGYSATMYDYRSYWSEPGSLTPMMNWDCRSPVPAWQRK